MADHTFTADLYNILSAYPHTRVCWIAYSGGLDSHVLLHILGAIRSQISQQLTAVHINHGLHPDAKSWQRHCEAVCHDYRIKYITFDITLPSTFDCGIEALAREHRYGVFSDLLDDHDLLLTAHHMNDQAETILLQMLRGTGTDGLAGIPQSRAFAKGWLLRPLLKYSKEQLRDYALRQSLDWIEDSGNKTDKYDRNFLRNRVMPLLLARWPGALKTLRRAAGHQADASAIIRHLSRQDLLSNNNGDLSRLDLDSLQELSVARQRQLLRTWIKANHMAVPGAHLIEKINTELINAGVDRNPCISWGTVEVRRYHRCLYIMHTLPGHDIQQINSWDISGLLHLSSGDLSAMPVAGSGIKRALLSDRMVEVRFRRGGERLGPADHGTVKKLLQEKRVLPWLRDRLPLIFHRHRLIAVADIWIASDYISGPGEPAWRIKWTWRIGARR